MRLISLQMNNFRAFYGATPRIEFADGDQNTTVIHAANGSGKTTLLNAFTYALYREFTPAFSAVNRLVNRRALDEAEPNQRVICWVELTFEHNGAKYNLRRTRTVKKAGQEELQDGPEVLSLYSPQHDGPPKYFDEAEIPDIIGRIIPLKLLPYFFFDGERIEQLQRSARDPKVISATTMLVGEEVIVRAINHLDGTRKDLEKEYRAIGDAEVGSLLDQKAGVEEDLSKLQSQYEKFIKYLEDYQQNIATVDAALKKLDAVRELTDRRNELRETEKQLGQDMIRLRSNLAGTVAKDGYKAFLSPAVASFHDQIKALKDQGQLPGPIKASFVTSLLADRTCICGRELHPGEEAYDALKKWEARGGMTEVEEVALRMDGAMTAMEREIPTLFTVLDRDQESLDAARKKLSKVEEELTKISGELKGSGLEDAVNLENRLTALNTAVDKTKQSLWQLAVERKNLDEKLVKLNDEVKRRQGLNAAQRLAKDRLEACNEARETLIQVQGRLRTNFREDLNERINRLFNQMSFKNYRAVLDPEYYLCLIDGSGTQVALSTGESALLSLAFVGAVIEQARALTARRDRLPGPDSSVFPIVMDSPFGNLDPIYRRQVAQKIPELAYQVVTMVSRSQFEGEVEKTLHNKIGREYVFCFHTTKGDVVQDKIARGGEVYPLIQAGSNADWTEILEVTKNG